MTDKLNHIRLKCVSCGSEWDEDAINLELNQDLELGEHCPDACRFCDSSDKTAIIILLGYNVVQSLATKET